MKEQIRVDKQVIATIFVKYQQAKLMLANNNFKENDVLQEETVHYVNNIKINENLKNYQKHVQVVDTVLALLPKTEYSYIVRTFLVKTNKNWWKKYYHIKEYEKLQKTAIKHFLYLYLI
ncbi:MG284/MPN403 family protein [Spiroplasma endosymbiont of Polydrusus pterygomalis]|uniref:MG284/MPN403 family protein n=1 Tax=Spiroplasma endosymbiont of Polydrusus pterygomalis TaxID=3139327 RepID=UPI003CCB51B6